MKMKKLLSVMLTVAMVASMTACGSQDQVTNNQTAAPAESQAVETAATEAETEAVQAEKPTTPQGQLVIGSTTDLEGEFYDPSFNNGATNYKMYNLIHGYSTVAYTKEGVFEADPTVCLLYTSRCV